MNKTVIVDYNAGNLKSIANMLNYDVQNKIVKDCLDELDRINEVRF